MTQPTSVNGLLNGWRGVLAALGLAVGWMGLGCDGEQNDFAKGFAPQLLATPHALIFTSVRADQPETLALQLSNSGTGTLVGLTYRLDNGQGPFTLHQPSLRSLGSGESLRLEISYQPDNTDTKSDTLVVEASHGQRIRVPLRSLPPRHQLQCVPGSVTLSNDFMAPDSASSVQIHNIGTLTTTISAIHVEAPTDSFVLLGDAQRGRELLPDERMNIDIGFRSNRSPRVEGLLRVETETGEGEVMCRLVGITKLPRMDVSHAQMSFGAVPHGETKVGELMVENTGEGLLVLEPPTLTFEGAPHFALVDAPIHPITLAPGQTQIVKVSYQPDALHEALRHTAALHIESNDPDRAQVLVPLSGQTLAPMLSVTPNPLHFGTVGGGAVITKTVTLSNDGDHTLLVDALVLDPSGAFHIEADRDFPPTTDSGPGEIEPGQSVDVRVAFVSETPGGHHSTLRIVSNEPNPRAGGVEMQALRLEEPARCNPIFRRRALLFEDEPGFDMRPTTRTLDITNLGTGPCHLQDIWFADNPNGPFEIVGRSHAAYEYLNPRETLTLDIAFLPTETGHHQSLLVADITDPSHHHAPIPCDDTAQCQNNPELYTCAPNPMACSIELVGVAGHARAVITPDTLNLGLSVVGCSGPKQSTVWVHNEGEASLDVQSVRLVGGCDDAFEIRGVPSLPHRVYPHTPMPIEVAYQPTQLGQASCRLEVVTRATAGQRNLRMELQGHATALRHQTDHFEQPRAKTDLLFVIDGSGSMQQELPHVAQQLMPLLTMADAHNDDLHIGVIHLNKNEVREHEGRSYRAGELMGSSPYLTLDHPEASSRFRSRVLMDASHGTHTAGLWAVKQALSPLYTAEHRDVPCTTNADCTHHHGRCLTGGFCGAPNAGFLRSDAALDVIFVSDADDQSTEDPTDFVAFLQALKGPDGPPVRVSSIVGLNPSTNAPGACTSHTAQARAGWRYAAVTQASGGVMGSICALDFAPFVSEMGYWAFKPIDQWALTQTPEVTSIGLRIDGLQRHEGWAYDGTTNTIYLDRHTVPDAGSTIVMDYDIRCEP